MSTELIRLVAGLVITISGLMLWPRLTRLPVFFALIVSSILFALIAGLPISRALTSMQQGFGSLIGQIGFVIALGSVLGSMLEKTGAMSAISQGILNLFGRQRPALALSVIGALVGIPVFCDSAFIVLSKLIPELAARSGAAQGTMVLALSSSLLTTHTLVPPTPGPLAAAATLGLSDQLGLVILIGLAGSIPVVVASFIYARARGHSIQVRQTQNSSMPERIPGFLFSFLPLAIPVILIASGSIFHAAGATYPWLEFLSQPTVALLTGVVLSFALIRSKTMPDWPNWITEALRDAGIIILITGAGGAFGAVIKEGGLSDQLQNLTSHTPVTGITLLLLGWTLSAVLKTAQGSSTSAMIITSAVLAPLTGLAGYTGSLQLATLSLAIGAGSMAVSHANDSYFWVVSQFGGLSPQQAFSRYTPMTLLQSLVGLVAAVTLFLLV